ncbi:N-acetylmuramoyl-L-alanine amidase [Pseudomonas sp. Fl5BN2]|uniref:N-acetylmuramoyl-L-alanine amidase n=1 Tax=unclassified Pseudomonas TaxID=196821 RepID=UPI001376E649|nr:MULTISPECIES: N-acetylmuramoyl-L-alanine amidase [unclassified Pseudomonas]NBF05691.1 N-acetylmuramoyl-L-alanine amidase [Pseudomonas sp. Fl5BN2]NBF11608.1 N-acetylmuramoyl-L-alanine amidase [Pseudomonas sp. Fl4BN1]
MYQIDYNRYRSVKSFNRRVRFLVMHYTAVDFKASIASLTGPSVSAHYLIPDPTDNTYLEAGFKDMRIFNLVDETERAWHAGASAWAGRRNLNDTAIGIEIVNLATDNNGIFTFPPYHALQVDAIKQLALNIIQRYPDITPPHIIGHSDIAPGRKTDPGAAFPWQELHAAGIGAWYDDATKQHYLTKFCNSLPSRADLISKLGKYGYDTSSASTDSAYKDLIRAFQLHFRQKKYDGVVDVETAATLYALVDKYFPTT